jgi:hypothetical protein
MGAANHAEPGLQLTGAPSGMISNGSLVLLAGCFDEDTLALLVQPVASGQIHRGQVARSMPVINSMSVWVEGT